MKFIKLVLFTICIILFSNDLSAQNLLSGKDLSTIKVETLTDAEISQIQAQLKQAGVSIDQVEQQAIAKGMSAAEFAKLKARLSAVKSSTNNAPLSKKTVNKPVSTKFNNLDSVKTEDFFVKKVNPLVISFYHQGFRYIVPDLFAKSKPGAQRKNAQLQARFAKSAIFHSIYD